jgi:predicted nucleic acid-binding protein
MRSRVFLDSNVFINAFENSDSNSLIIIEMLTSGEIEAVVSERVLKEVMRYFKCHYGREYVAFFRDYILQSCVVVFAREIRGEMGHLKGRIKDKDLEQLAATRALGLRYLVSFDRHFEPFEEYITPKRFVESLGRKARPSEY